MSNEEFSQKVILEIAKDRSKDVYDDGFKLATKESGEILQTVIGFFNHVVLYPVKLSNITYKYKLEMFEEELKFKMAKLPVEGIANPPLNISGPVLEGLKYTFEIEEIREMFLELLCSSMNKDEVDFIHPSFVEIIKSMSQLDAQIIRLFKNTLSYPASTVRFRKDDKQFYALAMPMIFVPDFANLKDIFTVCSSIENLIRLGLLNYREDVYEASYDYSSIKENEAVLERYKIHKDKKPTENITIDFSKSIVALTEFGRNFVRSCIGE